MPFLSPVRKLRSRMQAAAQATAPKPKPKPAALQRRTKARGAQRIRYSDRPGQLVAEVEVKGPFGWRRTGKGTVIDLGRMKKALDIADAQARGDTGYFDDVAGLGGYAALEGAAPFDLFSGPFDARVPGSEFDDTAGLWDRVKKAAKKVAKNKIVKIIAAPATVPLKLANKYTHEVGPIAKLEKQIKKTVKKNLPFTKPFIGIHDKLAAKTQEGLAAAGLAKGKPKPKTAAKAAPKKPAAKPPKAPAARRKAAKAAPKKPSPEQLKTAKAKAIADATKKLPPVEREVATRALVARANAWQVISPRTGQTLYINL